MIVIFEVDITHLRPDDDWYRIDDDRVIEMAEEYVLSNPDALVSHTTRVVRSAGEEFDEPAPEIP